jgi:hypothetical protein
VVGTDFEEKLHGIHKSGCGELKRSNSLPTDKECAPQFLMEQS